MNKFERKFGRYAIKNLSLVLIIGYVIGYVVSFVDKSGVVLNYLSLNPYAIIFKGQVWRLFTWILIPPESFDILTIVMLIFYYSIGNTLQRTWGDWLYNIYIFSGMLFTIVGMFLLLLFSYVFPNGYVETMGLEYLMQVVSRNYVSTYYINMSIFLAFAATFPDSEVLLMFIIPVKMKYLGVLYGVLIIYEFAAGNMYSRIVIVISLLNFIVFFLLQRKRMKGGPRQRVKQAMRRRQFNSNFKKEAGPSISKHKCAICGRTDTEYPDLEFRFCSKCNGNYEYCSDHLFTHRHIE